MTKPSTSKKRVAAKKTTSSSKARKAPARPPVKPSPAKAAPSRPSATETARVVERYEPRQIEGTGWKPFRYPPE